MNSSITSEGDADKTGGTNVSCPAVDANTLRSEYEQANEWWRHLSQMRRRDMALFTAAQGAVVTVVGSRLLNMDFQSVVLSGIAFLIALIGLNNEKRLYAYLYGFRERGSEIEKLLGMRLIGEARGYVKKQPLLSNSIAFPLYYGIIGICWVVIWLWNLCHMT